MTDTICLNNNIFLKKITDESFFVFNSVNKKSYEIGETEYKTMLTMKDETSFEKLCDLNKERMNPEQLKEFCKCINQLGFLKGSKTKGQKSLTTIKFGLFNPSKYLDSKSGLIRVMHWGLTRMPILAMILGILSFFYPGAVNVMELFSSFELSANNIMFSAISILVITTFHELGHMSLAIYYGVPVPEVGLMLYWFTPCAYADVSAIHFIKDKYKKTQILLGGVYTHIIWIGLGLCAVNLIPAFINYTLPFIIINLALIFVNITFYLKLDGYHILTTLVEEPLLRENSMALVLNSKVRKQLKETVGYSKFLAYLCVAFVSIIYIPALVMSVILRIISMLTIL